MTTVNIGGTDYDVSSNELQQVLLALLPSDIETASFHAINIGEALTVYGTYELPLLARLSRIPATGVTHYYVDKAVGGGAVNAQVDGIAWSALTAVDTVGVRHSNTCQIHMRAAAVGGSSQAEAEAGAVLGITDLINDQRDDAMTMLFKDMEYGLLLGVEATTSPRQMDGLKKRIGDLSSNLVDGSAAEFDEDMLIGLFEAIRDDKTGFFPNALYCSGRTLRRISSWTEEKVRFVVDLTKLDQLKSLAAGQAAGVYVTPDGHMVQLLYHPYIGHDGGTPGNNYCLAVTESLVKIAFLRSLRVIRTANVGDSILDVILAELTLQLKAGDAHGKLYNYKVT